MTEETHGFDWCLDDCRRRATERGRFLSAFLAYWSSYWRDRDVHTCMICGTTYVEDRDCRGCGTPWMIANLYRRQATRAGLSDAQYLDLLRSRAREEPTTDQGNTCQD